MSRSPSTGPAIGLPVSNQPVQQTVYDTVDQRQLLGARGQQGELINKQGLRLATYLWPAENAKAVLIFVHGHGAHLPFDLLRSTGPGQAPQYTGSWAERFNAAGISVCGVDNQGCGRSEGARGLRFYVESFDDYVDDVLQFARWLGSCDATGFAGLPLFIGGLSMGGCIAYHCIRQEGALFRGAVLMAPMLSLEKVSRKGINPYIRPLSRVLSWLWPTAEIVATDKNTLYPEIQEEWDQDPLTMAGKTRVRNANEYLRITEETMRELEGAAFPFLLVHSENDTMCDCDGSKQLYLRAQSGDKQLLLVNHMWHVLQREKGNEKLQADIIDWILARSQ